MNKRRFRFPEHPLEKKYLRLLLLAMFLPSLFVMICLYYVIWQIVAYEVAVPELIASSLVPAYRTVNNIIVVGMPVLTLLILLIGMRLAHQLAGPLKRIEKELDEMIQTRDFSKSIQIRQKDELRGFVEKVNEALRVASQH